jgi:hypothetical protein
VAKQATELRYAVRFRVVFKYFGQLCPVLAALTLVPLVMSVIFMLKEKRRVAGALAAKASAGGAGGCGLKEEQVIGSEIQS